jgi:hypothetical protein
MMFTPIGGLIGSGVPSLPAGIGPTALAMGALVVGLLALATIVLVVADWRAGS